MVRFGSIYGKFTPALRAGIGGDRVTGCNCRDGVPPAPDLGAVMRGEYRLPSSEKIAREAAATRERERERQRAAAGPVDRTVPPAPSLIPRDTVLRPVAEASAEQERW
jgi:hypothetical protein